MWSRPKRDNWTNVTEPSPRAAAVFLDGISAKLHNSPMIDWNDLRYFLAVARQGSTLAAASPQFIAASANWKPRWDALW
jgi:hypothetical protein